MENIGKMAEKVKRRNEKNEKRIDEERMVKNLNEMNKYMPKKFINSLYKLKKIVKKEVWKELVETINKLEGKDLCFNKFLFGNFKRLLHSILFLSPLELS